MKYLLCLSFVAVVSTLITGCSTDRHYHSLFILYGRYVFKPASPSAEIVMPPYSKSICCPSTAEINEYGFTLQRRTI